MVLVYSAECIVWRPLKAATLNGHVDLFRLLLNHGLNADITGNDGRTPVRVAA